MVWKEIEPVGDAQILHQDMDTLIHWSVQNAVPTKVGKYLFMSISKETSTAICIISSTLLLKTDTFKDVVVLVQYNLST